MSAPRPRSKDFGAAIAGLVLGGSVLFLIMLAIVWLTNSHFEGLEASGTHGAAPVQQATPAATQAATPAAIPAAPAAH